MIVYDHNTHDAMIESYRSLFKVTAAVVTFFAVPSAAVYSVTGSFKWAAAGLVLGGVALPVARKTVPQFERWLNRHFNCIATFVNKSQNFQTALKKDL